MPIKDLKSGDITGGLPRLSELFEARNDDDDNSNPNNPYNVLNEILDRKGLRAAQKKLINEIQEVYRLQGVKINDKHFEVIVRQMTQKVEIIKSGDTSFLEGNIEFTDVFLEENKRIFNMKFIEESGDSKKFFKGQLVNFNELKKENYFIKK